MGPALASMVGILVPAMLPVPTSGNTRRRFQDCGAAGRWSSGWMPDDIGDACPPFASAGECMNEHILPGPGLGGTIQFTGDPHLTVHCGPNVLTRPMPVYGSRYVSDLWLEHGGSNYRYFRARFRRGQGDMPCSGYESITKAGTGSMEPELRCSWPTSVLPVNPSSCRMADFVFHQ